MCVDLTLYPLDTVKTRMQSQQGFHKAGGFRGIYAGVPSAAVGSFPNAAAFFVTYECTKSLLGASGALSAPHVAPVTHMLAASLGEIVACLIRVPTEVVKQRTQASPSSTTYRMLLATLRAEGVRGLYRGFGSTVLREIPFSLVQFPLWEYLKTLWSRRQGHTLYSWQAAVCGAFAGAAAAFVTTPLDVAKTRIILAKWCPSSSSLHPPPLSLLAHSNCMSGFSHCVCVYVKGSEFRVTPSQPPHNHTHKHTHRLSLEKTQCSVNPTTKLINEILELTKQSDSLDLLREAVGCRWNCMEQKLPVNIIRNAAAVIHHQAKDLACAASTKLGYNFIRPSF
ncbi:mitochondrial S-adenosylmethionine carrier protein isoform X2 [Anarrhichthys ocellatus]|nr:S-adenosylmethionine mitochondrial carrier protein isoform X2 [Anarrhichthys ocellatus]